MLLLPTRWGNYLNGNLETALEQLFDNAFGQLPTRWGNYLNGNLLIRALTRLA